MGKRLGTDVSNYVIPGALVKSAVPILIGSSIMAADSIIQAIWVGHLLGGNAVAAIGACFPIILALAALSDGVATATSNLIAQRYKAKDYANMHRFVNISFSIALVMIIIITSAGYFASEAMLKLLGTPAEIMFLATGYLKIMTLGFFVMYLAFAILSTLRSVGKTSAPMIYILVSTIGGLILTPVLILGIGPFPKLGLYGAALATLIAGVIASIICIIYIVRNFKGLLVRPVKLIYERGTIAALLPLGLSSFMPKMLATLGYLLIIIFVNKFGSDATAAFYIISRVDSIVALPAIAVMTGVSMITSRILNTGKQGQVKDIFRWGMIINTPMITVISLICLLFPGAVMLIFIGSEAIIDIGVQYLRIAGVAYLLFIILYISNGILNGAGKYIMTVIFSIASLLIVRVPLALILTKADFGLKGIWLATVYSYAATTVFSLLCFISGKWKSKSLHQGKGGYLEG